MRFIHSLPLTLILTLATAACTGNEQRATKPSGAFVSIGTGSVTGVYYPTGGAIAKMINSKASTYNIKASAESTAGSVFNINAVMQGDLEFGIVQSDAQYFAVNGKGEWKDRGKQTDLRAICSFHAEAVTLVAAAKSNIKSLSELKGKTVNIGPPGSGMRTNALDVMKTAGINPETDLQAESLKGSEAPKMLQDARLDAFFYTVGHPSGVITEASSGAKKVTFVPITGMESLTAESPFYSATSIPAGLYPQMTNDSTETKTIGVKATFVTSAKVPDDVVYAITKEIFENLEDFKKQHAAFSQLTKKNMLEALSAPIHPGALKYYKEAGLKP